MKALQILQPWPRLWENSELTIEEIEANKMAVNVTS